MIAIGNSQKLLFLVNGLDQGLELILLLLLCWLFSNMKLRKAPKELRMLFGTSQFVLYKAKTSDWNSMNISHITNIQLTWFKILWSNNIFLHRYPKILRLSHELFSWFKSSDLDISSSATVYNIQSFQKITNSSEWD